MSFINENKILSEVVEKHCELIPVINRFGIRLGLSDNSIRDICYGHGISPDFNLLSFKDVEFKEENESELSNREIEVLKLIAQGFINKEIADKLNISLNTVLSHRKNITSKLGIKTVSGLTFYSIANGYINGESIEI